MGYAYFVEICINHFSRSGAGSNDVGLSDIEPTSEYFGQYILFQ